MAQDIQPSPPMDTELSASQSLPIPVVSETTETFAFDLAIKARCPDDDDEYALHVMVADTLVEVTDAEDSGQLALPIAVPASQLIGLQSGLLCDRAAAKGTETTLLNLPGAFSAQIALVCQADQRVKSTRMALPLAVTIDCPAGSPETEAIISAESDEDE
ncbi:MAG: hypothetical protein AAAFM81_14570 [Pseudomonadota bacterium]